MITHKGYTGIFKVDADAGMIRGKVVGIRDVITFQGKSVDEAKKAFRDSVDDYLDFCKADGVNPERPCSGKVLVRLKPDVHRGLVILAETKGVSVNALINGKLSRMVVASKAPRGRTSNAVAKVTTKAAPPVRGKKSRATAK